MKSLPFQQTVTHLEVFTGYDLRKSSDSRLSKFANFTAPNTPLMEKKIPTFRRTRSQYFTFLKTLTNKPKLQNQWQKA